VNAPSCSNCRYFDNDPRRLESSLPGWRVLGSAQGAVRDSDGMCAVHERYLRASSLCSEHSPVAAKGAVSGPQADGIADRHG
jgi:hypothetical protein